MKWLRWTLLAVLSCLVFCVAFYAFFPWQQVGAFSVSAASARLAKQGMHLSCEDVEEDGRGFRLDGVRLEGLLRCSFASVTVHPNLLSSLLAFAPVADLSFTGGSMAMGNPLGLGNGKFTVTLSQGEVVLSDIQTDGDARVRGALTIDPARAKIGWAEAEIVIPPEFEENMTLLKGFLPLEREGEGHWFLRRSSAKG